MAKFLAGRRGIGGLLLITFLTGGVLAAAIFTGTAESATPVTLQSEGELETLPATMREYSARSAREIEFTLAPALPLLTAANGRVTNNPCNPSDPLESSMPVLEINGHSIFALHTTVPLWRDLELRDRGKDVSALHAEFQRLEIADIEGDVVTQATLRGFAKIIGQEKVSRIALEALVWLPEEQVELQSCELTTGEEVASNDVVALLKPQPERAQINNWSPAINGKYVLEIGDVSVPMASDGVLNDSKILAEMAQTPEFHATFGTERPVARAFGSGAARRNGQEGAATDHVGRSVDVGDSCRDCDERGSAVFHG